MFSPLGHPTYRRLLAAQILSLIGTGLATVALGLLAFDLAGAEAGAVLGTALAIKMVCYVAIAPVAGGFAHVLPRRALLVGLDLLRAAIVLVLPFVTEVWQVYLLIAVLQSASAAFTPTFQATIPDILTDEAEYTRALSLSRLAYDTEALASPLLAAALLLVIGFHWLFAGTALGFVASALLVRSVMLPTPQPAEAEGWCARVTRGLRLYLAAPPLRGLLALNLAVAAAGAMVLVNTVVLVRRDLGLGDDAVAVALAAYGLGSMAAALVVPRLLEAGRRDRAVMLAGAALLAAGTLLG
ncbi:MFS transporter, partial [Falsiroseomonas oryziterrae]|uniref:MFS transporter n=1 Tax=Falsiroseomonas oryziterrae TaxID=2911368 RepID=UPI001EFFE010